MLNVVLNPQIDLQPEDESKFSAYLFFVLFIIVGAFFILNLFVGVIIDNFNKMKEQVSPNLGFLTISWGFILTTQDVIV